MIYQFVALLIVHFVADFMLQTHWQASNKSKRNDALLIHVAVYTLVLSIGAEVILQFGSFLMWLGFALLNGVLHFATDWCTSRITSRLFMAQFNEFDIAMPSLLIMPTDPVPTERRLFMKRDFNPHNFFVVIGLDQMIHQLTLAATMIYFFGSA